jgi:hypothetical protein
MRVPVVAMLLVSLPAVAACGERRDLADLAAGAAPFETLSGLNAPAMRSGGVRAFRAAAVPAPGAGLHEPIAGYDVVYLIPGFDGADGSWPSEDALVYVVEASREWESDSAARAAFDAAVRSLREGIGTAPRCLASVAPAPARAAAQWERDGGWSVTASFAAALREGSEVRRPARHSIAVRREPLTGWRETPCEEG